MNECIIGIGSNINAEENIREALNLLEADFNVLGVSEMMKTKPIGIENQADFVNGAVKIKTELQQNELQQYLKELEDRLGRDRSVPKFGPRTIDLDIVVWNNKVVDDDYYTRDFLQNACAQLI
jgi:2-amino-4-hydroxy-6-hydroxymethyldihydropteridine diphosphokinase